MKKGLLFIAAAALATTTFAQDGLTSKKGEAYLPEAGDWSIGFDATRFTEYVGNMFNGGTNTALTSGGWMNGTVGQEIRAKMFKDETTAYRLRVRLGTGASASNTVLSGGTNGDSLATTTKTNSGMGIVLGAGMEKRRGNTRIQGYYGGEAFFGLLGGAKTSMEYDEVINDTYTGVQRLVESKGGSTFALGLQGFVGVEWFFAPKVSLGAEYTWGLSMSSTGEGETTTEDLNSAGTGAEQTTSKSGKSSSFAFDTGHNANMNLNFHF